MPFRKIPLAWFGLGLATVFSKNLASYSRHLKLLALGRSALKLAAWQCYFVTTLESLASFNYLINYYYYYFLMFHYLYYSVTIK